MVSGKKIGTWQKLLTSKVRLIYQMGIDVLKDFTIYLSDMYLAVYESESDEKIYYTD